MGCQHDHVLNGITSTFFGSGSDVLGCDWWRNFYKKGKGFFVVATRLFCKTMCTVTAKEHNCRFLVLKRKIQNVAAGCTLFLVVETSRFFG